MVFLHPATLARENAAGDDDLRQQLQPPVARPRFGGSGKHFSGSRATCASRVVVVGNPED
jgi:hypothetical protein